MKRIWIPNMRMVSCAVILLVLWTSAYAQSQPPIPSASRQGGEPPEDSKENKAVSYNFKLPPVPAAPAGFQLPEKHPVTGANAQYTEDKTPEWWMVGITGIMAVIAGFQLWLFLRQLAIMEGTINDAKVAAGAAKESADAAKASVALAENTAQRQLRAYVAIVYAKEKDELDPPDDVFRIKLRNCGQTPAYEVECKFGWKSLDGYETELPNDEPFLTVRVKSNSKGTVGAGIQIAIDTQLSGMPSYPELLMKISSAFGKKTTVYFYGTIYYMDVFGKDVRTTNFCFRFLPGKHPSSGIVYGRHNDST